jgi:inner membrane protein
MPSPIGHSLAGLCGYFLAGNRPLSQRREYLLLSSVVIANLPDLDLVPRLLFGDVSSLHRQWTHSLVAALGFGLLIGVLARWWKTDGIFYGIWGGAIYLSHIVLDMLLNDPSPPHGVQLLWPFSQSYFMSPFTPFRSFRYGHPELNIITMFFLPHNLATMAREVLLMTPWVGLSAYVSRRFSGKHEK